MLCRSDKGEPHEHQILDGGCARYEPLAGTGLHQIEKVYQALAARLPGIIAMQPTTAPTEPRGESGSSQIRFNTGRTRAATNEATGRPGADILSCRAYAQGKSYKAETEPQKRGGN